jgi:hypothetical protein
VACRDGALDNLHHIIRSLDEEIGKFGVDLQNSAFNKNARLKAARLGIDRVEKLLDIYSKYPYVIGYSLDLRVLYDGIQFCGSDESLHEKGKKWIKDAYDRVCSIPVELNETKKYVDLYNDPFSNVSWMVSKLLK